MDAYPKLSLTIISPPHLEPIKAMRGVVNQPLTFTNASLINENTPGAIDTGNLHGSEISKQAVNGSKAEGTLASLAGNETYQAHTHDMYGDLLPLFGVHPCNKHTAL